MRRETERNSLAMVALAVWAAAAAPSAAERIERDLHESFDVSRGARLELEHGDGDVTITPWERDVIQVDVRYRMEYAGIGVRTRGDFEVRFDQSGDVVRIEGREPSFSGIGIFGSRESLYEYEIQAPAWVALELRGDDGDVEIEGWRAAIELRLGDGDVSLRDVVTERVWLDLEDGDLRAQRVEAKMTVTTDDGDVDLADCAGAIVVRTEDGDVRVRRGSGTFEIDGDDGAVRLVEVEASAVVARLQDGDIDIELVGATADIDLRTDDGNIDLRLPAGFSAGIEISHGDGDVRLDVDGGDLSKDRHRVTGRLGGSSGAGSIRIATADGDVTVRQP